MKVIVVSLSILPVIYFVYIIYTKFRNNYGSIIGLTTLVIFPVIVYSYFTSWPEKSVPLILVTLGCIIVFGIYWYVETRHLKKLKEEEEEKKETKELYDTIQETHGSLNQLTERPLNDEERKYLHSQLKLNYWLGGIIIFLEIGGIIWIYLYGGDVLFIYILLGVLVLSIVAVVLGHFEGNSYLKKDTMYSLTAVVLDKIKIDKSKQDDFYVVLGDKEDEDTYKIPVLKNMYNKINYGDILLVNNFRPNFRYGRIHKIEILGSINKQN
ncbi:MAG: hypothetical protein R3345_12440 [Fulvivirga sp.]|nr:hypothetical protein [Fulvivirga sp.]